MSIAHVAVFAVATGLVHLLLFVSLGARIASYVLVLVGAALSVLLYQLWAYVDLGLLDPFFLIAAAVQSGISLLVGALVAVAFRSRRAT